MKKIAFISGASGGIGSACAKELSKDYTVLLHYLTNKTLVEETQQFIRENGGDAYIFQGDLSSYEDTKRMFDEIFKLFPHIHLLVNSCGIASYRLFLDETAESWNRLFNTNVHSVFHCCHFLLPDMIRRKQGKIINISSLWGIVGASGESAYAATKGAIDALTKSLALELGYCNIQVNAVAPGAVDTAMLSTLSEEDAELLRDSIPAGRFARSDEIAKLVAFLASSAGDYMSGQIISPNGAWATY